MKQKLRNFSGEKTAVLLMLGLVAAVTLFPYLKNGLSGYGPDLTYHLLRVEGIKEALLHGDYPIRIYNNFFDGYGYGSPMFYPDIFFIFPAVLRIIGASPVAAWKIFAMVITLLTALTTYYAYRLITGKWRLAVAGTFLLSLSQFYLADLMDRAGISEYIAYIFLPLLAAAFYDYFELEGRRSYLFGIGFTGLLLSHTIMAFLGGLLVAAGFLAMLFIPTKRREVFRPRKFLRLLLVALVSLGCVAYYLFPMMEQMYGTNLRVNEPWAHVGDYTQPLYTFFEVTGYFNYIAYVGIGIPVLLLIPCRVFVGKPKNRWADAFFFVGGALLLLMTRLFPWSLLNNTFFNTIQFTYRFYPAALLLLILGILLILGDHYGEKLPRRVLLFIILAAVLFGGWQNVSILEKDYSVNLTEADLEENDDRVGKGEWLPGEIDVDIELDEVKLETDGTVRVPGGQEEITFERGYLEGTFDSRSGQPSYEVPFIFYKGYRAEFIGEDGTEVSLPVSKSEHGLVQVDQVPGEGVVRVHYTETLIQNVSKWISAVTVIGTVLYGLFRWKRGRKK